MAAVILGGLCASTALSLFVMPTLYSAFGETRDASTQDAHR